MRRLMFAACIAIGSAGSASATSGSSGLTAAQATTIATAVQTSGSNLSADTTQASGSTTTQTLASRAAETRSVRDYGAACDGTTDDSPALAAAAAALRDTGAQIRVPGNCRLRLAGTAQVWLKGVHLVGDNTREIGSTGPSLYGQQGSTILLDSTALSPFVVSNDWGMTGLVFNWPRQTEANAVTNGNAPIVFPPLIAVHGSDVVESWQFSHNQVENAYDIFDLRAGGSGTGHFHIDNNQLYALRYYIRVAGLGGESFVTDNQFSPIAYLYGILGTSTTHLRDYAAANAEIIRVEGNGTTTTQAASSADGQRLSGNYALGVRYALHVVGGTYNLATWTGNSFDEVPTAIGVDSGGAIDAMTAVGGTWLCQWAFNTSLTAPCITINGGAPGSSLTMSGVDIPVVAGPGVVFHDTGTSFLAMSGGRLANVGQINVGNPYNGVDFNAPNGVLTLANMPITTTATNNSATAQGVSIEGSKTSVLSGLTLGGWNIPLVYNATAGTNIVTGSTSYGTTAPAGTSALLGGGAAMVTQSGNSWDVGVQTIALQAAAGQSDNIRCGGASTNVGCGLSTKGSGGLTLNSDVGTVLTAAPSGSGAQTAYATISSGSATTSVTYSASAGNVQLQPPSGGITVVSGLPLCAAAPSGILCATSASPGSAIQVK